MGKLTLSLRLFLITAIALVPTTAVLLYNLVSLRITQEQQMHAEASRISELVALEMNQIVGGTENVLRAVASASAVRRADAAGCERYLARIIEQMPEFVSIAIIDRNGVIRCMPYAPAKETFVGDRDYFTEVLATGQTVVGEFDDGRITNRPSLPIAIPLIGDGAWSGGVVAAGVDLGWLGLRIKDRYFAPGSALTIADRKGRILAREPSPENFVGTIIPDAFQHLVTADAPGTLEVTSQDGTRRVIGYRPVSSVPAGVYVSAGLSTETAYAALDRAMLRGLLIAATSIIAAFLLARSTSNAFIRRPLNRLVATIDDWRREDLTARTGMTARDGEIGAVGKAIDNFMDELIGARQMQRKSEQQREVLLSELDHRVKNLLATVQAVARQSFPSSERTESVDVFMRRLATMSAAHGLLMRDEWQEADILRVMQVATEPFTHPGRSQFTFAGPKFMMNSQAVLAFGMALHELCTNAVKYGALRTPEGHVSVDWAVAPDATATGGSFRLIWDESGGPPIAPPKDKGFGSRMIEQVLAHQIDGAVSLDYRPTGLVCTVVAPLAVIGSRRDIAA